MLSGIFCHRIFTIQQATYKQLIFLDYDKFGGIIVRFDTILFIVKRNEYGQQN